MVPVRFLEEEYSASEGGDVMVCIELDGSIDREVVINISTQEEVGSASGDLS